VVNELEYEMHNIFGFVTIKSNSIIGNVTKYNEFIFGNNTKSCIFAA
jgi:hypothetical protein